MRDPAREEAFLAGNHARFLGRNVEWHDQLESTQDRLRELSLAQAPEGTVVAATIQTRGRGRTGAPWSSGPGGLWASVLLYPAGTAQSASRLTLDCAKCVCESLQFDFCLPATIKEPNDVLVNGKKISGILGESSSRAGEATLERIVMGVGLNVANSLPPELDPIATTLAVFLHPPPAPEQVLARLLERFESVYLRYQQQAR